MADIKARVERVIEEMMGNEALLEMLETNAATEMLHWGIDMAKSLVKKTDELDGPAADLALLPRLKEIRQTMRSIGNWAAGKYTDAASRAELREKLHGVIDDGAFHVVVDLTDATFVDSMTLGVLLGGVKRLRPQGGQLRVVVGQAGLRRIFEVTLLDRVFTLFPTRADALDRL